MSIHQKALQKVFFSPQKSNGDRDPEVSLLKQQLATLRKRRLDLHSEIQQVEFEQRLLPLSEELRTHASRTTRHHVDDSYRHFLEKPPPKEKDDEKGLARRMQSLRKRRRIVGSHRIAGVSIAPSQHYDDNILTVRIDVCVEGRYTAKHFMFFDIIVRQTGDNDQEEESQYFLRLAQHTLQPSIPLTKVLREHFGGELMLRLTTTALLTEDVTTKVRNLVGTLQDVCYAHAVRRQGVECLEKQIHTSKQEHGISNLVVTRDTLRRIDFDATFANHRGESRTLTIKLIYDDEQSPLPTTVSAASQQNESDDEDPQFLAGASKLLESKPLWLFLEEGQRLL